MAPAKKSDLKKVLELVIMNRGNGVTVQNLSEATGISKEKIRTYLSKLKSKGLAYAIRPDNALQSDPSVWFPGPTPEMLTQQRLLNLKTNLATISWKAGRFPEGRDLYPFLAECSRLLEELLNEEPCVPFS
jgi:biotin operon repressor